MSSEEQKYLLIYLINYNYAYWLDNSPILDSYWTRSASLSLALSLRSFSINAICSKWHFSCSIIWFSNARISNRALSTVLRSDANRLGSCCKKYFSWIWIQGRNHWENLVATSAIVGRCQNLACTWLALLSSR